MLSLVLAATAAAELRFVGKHEDAVEDRLRFVKFSGKTRRVKSSGNRKVFFRIRFDGRNFDVDVRRFKLV